MCKGYSKITSCTRKIVMSVTKFSYFNLIQTRCVGVYGQNQFYVCKMSSKRSIQDLE